MFTFNNETIFTGYIKQLLSDFNLPKYKVYTKADAEYHEEALKHNERVKKGTLTPKEIEDGDIETWPEESVNIIESKKAIKNRTDVSPEIKSDYNKYINYIKNNSIKRYIEEKGKLVWKETDWHYHYNKKELNETKNLFVKSNVYDSYTHEYLGDYLRFQRDYNNLDLMSMYNCFSDVICHNIYINHNTPDYTKKFIFDSDDKNYKIYIIPVKLFKKYTIAIDSTEPVEMCCSLYSKYYQKELDYDFGNTNDKLIPALESATYKKFGSMTFSNPIIYDKLWVSMNKKEGALIDAFGDKDGEKHEDDRTRIVQRENDLKLFIKLPLNNSSSITILEGDYTSYGTKILEVNGANAKIIENKSITNFSRDYEVYENPDFDKDTAASEDNKQYIYYNDEFVPTTSKQELTPLCSLQLLAGNTGISYPFADRLLEYLLENVITHLDDTTDNIKRVQQVIGQLKNSNWPEIKQTVPNLNGVWEAGFRHYLYQDITNDKSIKAENKQDLLGYVDKVTEKNYSAKVGEDTITIANVDIYPNIYKSNKK